MPECPPWEFSNMKYYFNFRASPKIESTHPAPLPPPPPITPDFHKTSQRVFADKHLKESVLSLFRYLL